MRLIFQLAASGALLVAVSQPIFAIQVSNQPAPPPTSAVSVGVIERGGTITAVDTAKRTIVVDNVKYALPARPVKVHGPAGNDNEKISQLKAGMLIRFATSKANYSAQEQVQEIWVTGSISKTTKK